MPNTKQAMADGVKPRRIVSPINNVNFTMDFGINFKKIHWNASDHATPKQKFQFFGIPSQTTREG